MMLLYKAWRESRTRILVGAIGLTVYCALMVVSRPEMQYPLSARIVGNSWGEYINNLIFAGTGKIVFVLSVIFLGVGGLLRERAHHTAAFTLALPVSRRQLVGAEIVAGLTGLALLALLPAILIQPLSALAHESYPVVEGLRYSFLRFICGVFIFAISFLMSVVLKGEYTAPLATFFAMFLPARADQWSAFLRRYLLNPMATMDGRWTHQSNVLDPFPWRGLSILMLIALAMFAVGTRITERQDL